MGTSVTIFESALLDPYLERDSKMKVSILVCAIALLLCGQSNGMPEKMVEKWAEKIMKFQFMHKCWGHKSMMNLIHSFLEMLWILKLDSKLCLICHSVIPMADQSTQLRPLQTFLLKPKLKLRPIVLSVLLMDKDLRLRNSELLLSKFPDSNP